MNRVNMILLLVLTLFSLGCAVQRQTKFVAKQIKPGMSKAAVIAQYGKPYKESSSRDDNHTLHEQLFYKEQLYLGRWYEVNSILHFENSIFKSLEQGKEQLLYRENQERVK